MSCPLHLHARACPDTLGLVTPEYRWTYAQFDARVASMRKELEEAGVENGSRVGFAATRSARSVLLLWALWRAEAVAVLISPRLPRSQRIVKALQVECDVVLGTEGGASTTSTLPVRDLPRVPVRSELQQMSHSGSLPQDRDATIVFTSGSTGAPKAALHTWANHLYSAKGANANLPLERGDRWLLSLSLSHVGGLAILVRAALAGATVVVPDPDASLAASLRNTDATHVSCVATQLRRLLAERDRPPHALRAVLLGGGPLPGPLLDRAHAQGWPVLTTYGSTEMGSQITTTPPGGDRSTLDTAGFRLAHRELRIDDDEQICVRGRPLFRGYIDEDGLHDPRNGDGWFPTGDRGRLDAQGRLHVLGRMDHMFVSGGENIQPEEIETHLEHMEGVERAVVVPVPSSEFGNRPVAFIDTSAPIREDALCAGLEHVLPRYKIPDSFNSIPEACEDEVRGPDRACLRTWAAEHHVPHS